MNPKICHRMAALGSLTTSSEPGSIAGVAVPYNRFSSPIYNEGPRVFRERIEPGALTTNADTAMYVQHDRSGVPLARVGAGTLSFTESSEGLRFTASLPESRSDVMEALQRGDLPGAVSIGFLVDDDTWQHMDQQSLRDVTAGRIVELSLVTAGAYPDARGTYIPKGNAHG